MAAISPAASISSSGARPYIVILTVADPAAFATRRKDGLVRRTQAPSGPGKGSATSRSARGMRHVDLSDVQLASSETARHINRDIVLELIRTSHPISRADLARRSGLQRSTVSQIVEQLIRENWVREGSVAT